jgi:hypothetical protein
MAKPKSGLLYEVKEWIEYNFGWQDWTKLRRRILTLLGLLLAVYVLLHGYRLTQSLYYSASTYGNVVSVQPIEAIGQSRSGSRTSVLGYRIHYVYRVDGVRYQQEQVVIGRWLKPKISTATVRYRPKHPEESVLILN